MSELSRTTNRSPHVPGIHPREIRALAVLSGCHERTVARYLRGDSITRATELAVSAAIADSDFFGRGRGEK